MSRMKIMLFGLVIALAGVVYAAADCCPTGSCCKGGSCCTTKAAR